MSRRKDNNEPGPKYFNSGVELIFRKSWNFFAYPGSFRNARNRRLIVAAATACRHRMGLKRDVVRPRDASQNFYARRMLRYRVPGVVT
jgi:hypothetical protein